MSEPIPSDTPITRTAISGMSDNDLKALVERLQERRLKAYSAYEAGQEIKRQAKHDKDIALMDKFLDRFVKEHEATQKKLEKLDKLALDILALKLSMED